MEFADTPAFAREFKRLCRRYRSLAEDCSGFRKVLGMLPRGTGGKHWNLIRKSDAVEIFKTRIVCLSLGSDKIRVVYAFHAQQSKIVFIELYYKGEKEREDQDRIKEYLKELS